MQGEMKKRQKILVVKIEGYKREPYVQMGGCGIVG
jgi:hypothetical protein